MATKRRSAGHQGIGDISKQILRDLRDEFISARRPAAALQEQYEGLSLADLRSRYIGELGHGEVDFDLALKELEDRDLVDTGPLVGYDNRPGSGVVIIGLYSKREFLYLKEDGYRAATDFAAPKAVQSPAAPRVHISGGTFHQSPLAFGDHATQLQSISSTSDSATVERLLELLAEGGVATAERAEVEMLVDKMGKGNLEQGKPLFKKIFALAAEGAKQTAWGILTALASKVMGLT